MNLANDPRQWRLPVQDPDNLGFCTANAGVGRMKHDERCTIGKYLAEDYRSRFNQEFVATDPIK